MSSYSSYSSAGAGAAIFMVLLSLAFFVFAIVVNWKIYEKAGHEGWKSIIPFYNNYILCDIVLHNGILFLLLFIPFVNVIFAFILTFKLAGVFGKGTGFGLGLIFLPIVFYPMLAFGDAEYIG